MRPHSPGAARDAPKGEEQDMKGTGSGMNMLSGPMWSRMIVFAMPLAFTGVLQQLFNAADVAVLGRFVSHDAMAAVGSCVPVIGLAVALCMGLSLGANVVVARYLGMGAVGRVRRAVHTAFGLAVVFGLAVTLLGEAMAGLLLEWLDVPASVMGHAESYLRVFLLGLPFMAVYNFLAAVCRSKGDTRTPLVALIAATACNIAGNLLLVLALDMEAGGVALATALANGLAAAILFTAQLRLRDELRLTPRRLADMDRGDLAEMLRIGLPAGVQGMVFSLSNLIVQAAINSLGPAVMAGSVAAFTIEINVYCFINAFGLAATTFVSQNYGAGSLARCRRATWVSMGLNLAVSSLLVVLIVCFMDPLLRIFSTDGAVMAAGVTRVLYVVLGEPINVVMETVSDAMRGYGYSLPPAMVTLVSICSIRVVWVFTVFRASPEFTTLMLVYPLSWAVTTVLLCLLYARHQRTLRPLRRGAGA